MFRLNFTMPMLEKMNEGVIVLDRQAKILTSNRAAEPWLASAKALEPALKRLIDEEVQGRTTMPVRIDLAAHQKTNSVPTADVWVSKNGRRDYAIFISPPRRIAVLAAPEVSPQLSEKRYVSLFGDEVRQQLALLQSMLQPSQEGLPHDGQAIAKQAVRVDQLLKDISDLTLLMHRDLVFAEERVSPAALLTELVPAVQHEQQATGCNVTFTAATGQQGVVYGSASWLRYALRVLVEGLIQGAAKYSRIALDTRQLGNFIVITGRVTGVDLHPFAKLYTSAPAAEPAVPPSDGAMRLLICQRIVDLHGGQLKLQRIPSPDEEAATVPSVESFTLTLATGLPMHERTRVSCSDCRYTLQAQSYAADMAQILSS
jgi:signal transduction histidine kinase